MDTADKSSTVRIAYFTDMLCVWAYLGQVRIDELKRTFAGQVSLEYRFTPIFGAPQQKIGVKWQDRGGFEGYGNHVHKICEKFPHIEINEQTWSVCRPTSSAVCHQYAKAVQNLESSGKVSAEGVAELGGRSVLEELVWRIRLAFFRDARDVSHVEVLNDIATDLNLPIDAINNEIISGRAMAELCRDNELSEEYRIEGSPTLVLNEGRQKLYGNVGYRIIEANVKEVLNNPNAEVTWC
jgi:predicted DsbA family dithiol-disulfide isomerase